MVDDGVDGYNDHGMEDWDREDSRMDEGDYDEPRAKTKTSGTHPFEIGNRCLNKVLGKSKKSSDKASRPLPAPPPGASSMNAYRPAISAAKEQEMLDSIMSSMDTMPMPETPPRAPRKRKPSPLTSSSPERFSLYDTSSAHDLSSDGADMSFEDVNSSARVKRQRTDSDDIVPKLESFSNLKVKAEEDEYDSYYEDLGNEAFIDMSEIEELPKTAEMRGQLSYKAEEPSEKIISKLPDSQPAWLSLHSSLKTADDDNVGIALKSNGHSSVTPKNVLETNGNFHFYWLDYLELDGKVYLTGKTKDNQLGLWLSCCVIVENIERNLFVFPRRKKSPKHENSRANWQQVTT